MIKSITITNYVGDKLKIDITRPEQSGFVVVGIDGLGPSKADINATDFASDDGSRFTSARLNPRNIVIELLFYETQLESIEDIRQKTYKYFPIKKELNFLIETDNRIADIHGYVESNVPRIFSNKAGCQISLLCINPNFYSAGPDGTTNTIFNGVEPGFEFPFSNESLTEPLLQFGMLRTMTVGTVFYEGDMPTGINIEMGFLGPVTGLAIYNTETRETMKLDNAKITSITGSGIKKGDEIFISTYKGNKYIKLLRDGYFVNIMNCLEKDADWFQLSKGDNIFAYNADDGVDNIHFKITNKLVYEGV